MPMRVFWRRWIAANAFGELVGLGATFGLGFGLFAGLTDQPGAGPAVLGAAAMTATGILEGSLVGWAQWWAIRPKLPMVARRSWVGATIVGALVAWFLGSLPMTIASLSAGGQEETAAQEPALGLMLIMASVMGLVAGLVLAYPQWRVLRRHINRSWWWLPANSLAWAAGMPIIFAGIDLAQSAESLVASLMIMASILALTGAVVGAIHGYVLVRLLRQADDGAAGWTHG